MIIYFDENMPKHLADAFNIIQKPEGIKTGNNISIRHFKDVFPGAKDVDWIPVIGKEGSCVVSQDINITRRKDEIELFNEFEVGLFLLRGPNKKQGLSTWQMLLALTKNWESIVEASLTLDRPFIKKFGVNFGLKDY